MIARNRAQPTAATLWGGFVFALGAALQLLPSFGALFAPASFILVTLAALLLFAGALRLAVGRQGIAGPSIVGSAALVLFGAGDLLSQILSSAMAGWPPGIVAPILGGGMTWLILVAGIIATVSIARAEVVDRFARWVLALPVAVSAVVVILQTVPSGDLMLTLTVWNVWLLEPLLLVVAGVTWALWGRLETIRDQLRRFNDAWRASTSVGGEADRSQPTRQVK